MRYTVDELNNALDSYQKTANENLLMNASLYLKEEDDLKKAIYTYNLNVSSLIMSLIDLVKNSKLNDSKLEDLVLNLSFLMHLIFDDENLALELKQNSFKSFKLKRKIKKYQKRIVKILSKKLKLKVIFEPLKASYHTLLETSLNMVNELKNLK